MNDYPTPWPFPVPPLHATITYDSVVDGRDFIFLVTHDYEDGQWQCLPEFEGQPDMSRARLVSLESLTDLDPTLLKLADMPRGYKAIRESAESDWIISPNHEATLNDEKK